MRILGWLLFAATCTLFVLQGLFLAVSDFAFLSWDVLVDHVFPLLGIGAMVGAGVGALIVSRYPRNLIGWLLVLGQLGHMVGMTAIAFRVLVRQGIVDAPWTGQVAGYLGDIFGTVFTVIVMSVIFMLAPDGRALYSRWRFAVVVPITAQVLWWAGVAAQPSAAYLPLPAGQQSLRDTFTAQALTTAGFWGMLLSITLGATVLVLRLLRSTGQERLQLRWIATGAAVLAGTFVLFALSDLLSNMDSWWILPEATALAYIFFSVSVGVAIFRYRLYDIDVILSRAIALGVLAIFVTVGYVVVVVAIGSVLTAFGTPGSTLYWPSLVATAGVAVAFQPIRAHVLRLADQLVYGHRAAPYEALAALSRRLADSPSPESLPDRVADATGRAVGAQQIVVRLGTPGGWATVRSATWRSDGGDPEPAAPPAAGPLLESGGGSAPVDPDVLVLPVQDTGERIGAIEVTMPAGRRLRTFERDLLQDAAAQAGVAFRNALLEAELAARVALGRARSAELAASRARLVDAEDEARERLAGAISRRVIPHLAAVDRRLGAGLPRSAAEVDVSALVADSELALEELRAVCRGAFPALLERRGLLPALSAQLSETHPLADLQVESTADRRLDRDAEAAGYLFGVEVAPTDQPCRISVFVLDQQLTISVVGGERWAADVLTGSDRNGEALLAPADRWQHVRDRVAALGGSTSARRDESGGLTVTAVIPLAGQPEREPVTAVQTSASRSGPSSDFGT